MTNEELKKKIVEIIISAIWKDAEADYDSTDETEACSIADALIAAGMGDVKEAEHRVAIAERALEILNDYECLSNPIRYYMKQAEKELAEENGGKKEV